MSRKKTIVILLVLIWAALFVASYFMSARIEGPRNLDTGFRRLDVFARYQFIALAVAVVSAVLGVVWRREARRTMLVGFLPLLVTAVLIAGLVVASMIVNPRTSAGTLEAPPKPATQTLEPVPQE